FGLLVQGLLAALSFVHLKARGTDGHPPVAAIEQVADAGAVGSIGNPAFASRQDAAHFKYDFRVAVVKRGQLRIGRLLIVVINVLAARGDYGVRQTGLAKSPMGDVQLMRPLVPDIAVAG